MLTLTNNGVKLIEGVVADFQKIVVKLEKGVVLCQEKKVKNEEQKQKLETENVTLDKSMAQAKKITENLNSLIAV